MPNYEYKCEDCESMEERNVHVDDREYQDCQECDGPLRRIFTFTGSVWSPTKNGGMS